MESIALLLTLMVGLFFLAGMFVTKFFKNKEKLVQFTTGFTLVLMFFLILMDLTPEIVEVLNPNEDRRYIIVIFLFSLFGFLLLKILDFFVPEHSHEHHEKNDNKKEHENHVYHIGFITAISLVIHNMLEGISMYIAGVNDLKAGLLMALSVGCHNLPLGIEIYISMSYRKEKTFSKLGVYALLLLSSFMGALSIFLMGQEINPYFEGILLSITLGMLLYISLCELLPEVVKNIQKKEIQWGMLAGVGLSILLTLL